MKLVIERDVPVRMRDGVELSADVYRPDTDTVPALLHRLLQRRRALRRVATVVVLARRALVEEGVRDGRERFRRLGGCAEAALIAEDGGRSISPRRAGPAPSTRTPAGR